MRIKGTYILCVIRAHALIAGFLFVIIFKRRKYYKTKHLTQCFLYSSNSFVFINSDRNGEIYWPIENSGRTMF